MTLGFRTKWPDGKPTFFVEKIISGYSTHLKKLVDLNDYYYKKNGFNEKVFADCESKIHTIREDKPDQWKAGNKIHFVINNRTKNRFQFAPVIPVISVQKIEIKHRYSIKLQKKVMLVYIDERELRLTDSQVEELAINDGFESIDQFCKWFKKDFTGKIIHWTNFKY